VQTLVENAARTFLTRFPVRQGDRFVLLRLDQIRWIEARANYVRVHGDDGVYLQRDSLRRLQAALDPERFVRISRYAIVNLDKVRSIERSPHGSLKVRLEGGLELASTRVYRRALRQILRRDPRRS
jgi:two-component system LytT family response regulator